MSLAGADAETRRRAGSDLCLSCGLCCKGAVFSHIEFEPSDRARLRKAGHDAFAARESWRFPCPALEGNACTVYGARPGVCRTYHCRMLAGVLDGSIPHDEASAAIAETTAQFETLKQAVPGEMPFDKALDAAGRKTCPEGIAPHDHLRLRLELVALQRLVDRHLRKSSEAPVVTGRAMGAAVSRR